MNRDLSAATTPPAEAVTGLAEAAQRALASRVTWTPHDAASAIRAELLPLWPEVTLAWFAAWRDDGTLAQLHAQLRAQARIAAGRHPQPSAAVIDSQSVRAADTVPRASRGWDAAKKVNGRKRHIAVDTAGLVLDVVITPASVQDRHSARPLLWNTHRASREYA